MVGACVRASERDRIHGHSRNIARCVLKVNGAWQWGKTAWGGKGDKPGQFKTVRARGACTTPPLHTARHGAGGTCPHVCHARAHPATRGTTANPTHVDHRHVPCTTPPCFAGTRRVRARQPHLRRQPRGAPGQSRTSPLPLCAAEMWHKLVFACLRAPDTGCA